MALNDFIGKWDFNFWIEENKSTILTITPDGIANTGVTYYELEISGNDIHLFIPDYVDYWGRYDGNIITGTAESNSNNWHWNAQRHVEPIIQPVSQKIIFESSWIIKNNTSELKDNRLKFDKNGLLISDLYGNGHWELIGNDLIITTANGFVTYKINVVDGEIKGSASNKIGQKWAITPTYTLIPKPIERNVIQSTSSLKENAEQYLKILHENNINYLYHFTARDNLASIKKYGGLFSWKYLQDHNIEIPLAGGGIDSRSLDEKYGLEDYVRLSICEKHPMLYYKKKHNGGQYVILKVTLDPVVFKDTLFSDMNAADARHHHGGGLEDFKRIRFECTKLDFAEGDNKKYKQAEVMVKTHLPLKYIININDYI